MSWEVICSMQEVPNNAGITALLNGKQVAIFQFDGALYALDNFDPFSEANVLSRGILGDIGGVLCVASPIYKQHFALQTGACLEDNTVTLTRYDVREQSGQLELRAA